MKKEYIVSLLSFVSAISIAFINKDAAYYGFILTIIAIIFFGVYTMIIFRPRTKLGAVDIKNHPFWSRLKFYKNYKVPSIDIAEPLKKQLFVSALQTLFMVAENKAAMYINNSDELTRDKACSLITKIVNSYEAVWYSAGYPKLFREKFHAIHTEKVACINYYIEYIYSSVFYPDAQDKKVAVLDCLLMFLQWVLVDIDTTASQINGQLTKELLNQKDVG